MFYTGISIFQSPSNYIHLRFVYLKVCQFYHKKINLNVELLFVGLIFLDGIRLSILKLLTLYRIKQMSKYIKGTRFLTSGGRT